MKYTDFLETAKQSVDESWDITDAAAFISKHTRLKGANYSFKDHEFQLEIISDGAQTVNVQKCSQIGLSEIMARYGVALCNMIPDFSVIVTFPFSGDASNFAKTRIDPFIQSSPRLRESINKKMNNGEIKQFGTSFMYFRGTNGKTQAISIPGDIIISDEIDRSDPHILSQYHSRLTHSDWKLRRNFSTPTIPGYGIAKEMDESLQHVNLCQCNHCNHWFQPDYFEHVKIPGFDNTLRAINKSNIGKTRYLEAQLLCPACGKVPSLQPEHRNRVIKNPDSGFLPHGYTVSPFDAPNLITVPDLIVASTKYHRFTEFVNQNLGLPESDASESITLADMNASQLPPGVDMRSTELHCMGIDQGLVCHIAIGRIDYVSGEFLVVYRERCPLGNLETRKRTLAAEWKVVITVIDSQPNVNLVQNLQKIDKNCFGGVYGKQKKQLEPFRIQMFEGEAMEGKLPIHTVQINRDKAFDLLMAVMKSTMKWAPMNPEDDELFAKHCLDMRRVNVFDDHMEQTWTWVKSTQGQDHYHHTLLYCWIACMLRSTASRAAPLPLMTIRTIKVKTYDMD